MKKLHLAIGVADIEQTVADYSRRFGQVPVLVIPGAYALWRTAQLNVSVRKTTADEAGTLRHLGWESDEATTFRSETDCNGIVWEEFSTRLQAEEIEQIWPGSGYVPRP